MAQKLDILALLNEKDNQLFPDEIEMLRTELETGGYDEEYVRICNTAITELLGWKKETDDRKVARKINKNDSTKQDVNKKSYSSALEVDVGELAPMEFNPTATQLTLEQRVFGHISILRDNSKYKSMFKEYIQNTPEIDESFIEANINSFKPWEMEAIVSEIALSESFLELHFNILSVDKIARHQKFSESFFIKHFPQFDAETVLNHGVNEWTDKSKRSKQLDVFLRLKGVKI